MHILINDFSMKDFIENAPNKAPKTIPILFLRSKTNSS